MASRRMPCLVAHTPSLWTSVPHLAFYERGTTAFARILIAVVEGARISASGIRLNSRLIRPPSGVANISVLFNMQAVILGEERTRSKTTQLN